MGPHPAVAAIRLAVRRVLHDILTEHSRTSDAPAPGSPRATSYGTSPATPPTAPSVTSAATTFTTVAYDPTAAAAYDPMSHAGAHGTSREPSYEPPGTPPQEPAHTASYERSPSPLVLVACSGGADSMALASALAFEAPKLGIRAGAVTVDHGLQPGSDLRAEEVVLRMRELGLDPVESIAVTVGREGGPEAAARDARYAALDAAAVRHGAFAVLLGHTRDDQAETVLLGLARGSGIRSLSGMAAVSGAGGRYRRPFLHIDRQTARKACMVQSLPVWDDPHNADPAYTRSRLRQEGLPALEKALGKGVVEALARTAQLSRDDADALDSWARQAEAAVRDSAGLLECAKLYALPPAVRRRILRRAAIEAGAPAGALFARHIEEVDRLITGWRGQGAINLPGKVVAQRQGGRLVIRQG
ncbi:tRNA lysidine(34) synthetase TilS [Streptomyces bicolor]|uniref:tRNA lysidine(34) synthetase TilS n=2 Tax=Streptomyces TaxID=1883 RepID=UPI0004E2311E|nr:tRNA lysidine(34) synthetase TilS [Streptomyces bicolor]